MPRPPYYKPPKAAKPFRAREKRGTAAERGYDGDWQKFRLLFLKQNPLCVECTKRGYDGAASEVDHRTPLAEGGARLDPANCRPLCKSCHSIITSNYKRTGVNEFPRI